MNKKILLAGNPNVGKSTVFNALTGMKQHTGNWTGKTVETSAGHFSYKDCKFDILDLPGIYSLITSSRDERAALAAIKREDYQCIVIVADACALRKNLYLILQIIEITNKAVLCLNMAEQAQKQMIKINKEVLSDMLGIPVVMTEARKKKGLSELKETIYRTVTEKTNTSPFMLKYDDTAESAINEIEKLLSEKGIKNTRGIAIHMIENSAGYENKAFEYSEDLSQKISEARIRFSEKIYNNTVKADKKLYLQKRTKADKMICSRFPGIAIMLLLFALVIFLTVTGANYPSQMLSYLFESIGNQLRELLNNSFIPSWLSGLLMDGIYLTLTNVIAVMLPPMAIFFPLFAILEDIGYLPRAAFILDPFFKKAGTNGKQGLTMMMGLGCNSCGITGCRIIGDDAQRNIAILTNNFIPCNGRFPALIMIVTIFFSGTFPFVLSSLFSSVMLLIIIMFSAAVSLAVTKLLSVTLFKTKNSSFILELPEYRMPQFGKTILRSAADKTAVITGRAITVAAPAGAVIWLLTNFSISGKPVTDYIVDFLSPFGAIMGLDGVILTAFILGFPANEIVLPIMLMLYTKSSILTETGSAGHLFNILSANGWTVKTAVCMLILTLMHYPCSTSCITVKKATGSIKLCLLSILIPTLCGIICCIAVNMLMSLMGF